MSTLGWAQSWRIARRDLASGFRGLRLLFICLFLGVATLAAIGSLTSAITGEIEDRGQTILGGDIQIEMTQRELGPGERAELETLGQFSETIRLRAMAQRVGAQKIGGTDGPPAVLTELKGVDNAYPLYGKLTLRDGQYAPLPADRIIIGEALATRLDVSTGDQIRYGSADFTRAIGMDLDMSKFGFGVRSRRYAMVIDDLIVTVLKAEKGGELNNSKAEVVLESL